MVLMKDGIRPASRKTGDAGMVKKQLVATFTGAAYSAEREGDDLLVYLTSSEGFESGALGDRAPGGPVTAARLQARNEARRKANA